MCNTLHMSLKHAILVLLENEPGSGYDLAQRFHQGIGNFWRASHQQIYQQLKGLDEAGWVRFETETQQGKPDRKVYRSTPAGGRELRRWLAEPVKSPVLRDALLVKVFAGDLADRQVLLAELQRQIARQREILSHYRGKEAAYFALAEPGRRRMRLPYLTLRRGIRHAQDMIGWLEETHAMIAGDLLPDAPVAGA